MNATFAGSRRWLRSVAICVLVLHLALAWGIVSAAARPSTEYERVIEWTIESKKIYADPFNDVDVDVIFSKDGQSWRVPTFWRGVQRWTVRFAPPAPGEYSYRLESTDSNNPDLNGPSGRVGVTVYKGRNRLFRHGALRVSASGRYFEFADGTPFFWLGDTWWHGLSDRLNWRGFQKLAADRKSKGFTLVQLVAGLVPFEESGPADPGFRNEGGQVWENGYARINPRYFDYADRRISHLLDLEMVPAIFGGWNQVLPGIGVRKMEQHWRYLIARYGAYPVFWVVGGELFDPPLQVASRLPEFARPSVPGGWTAVANYIRAVDPYRHPLTAHEGPPPLDFPVQDESLLDFDMIQSNHGGWPSIGVEVAQINMHYARTAVTKPIVQGEIGYEKLGETHFEDFQRVAFWLSMLNGGAGHTYGANGTWEAYTADKPLHRIRWSFINWEEGMNLPGSYQVGLGAKLLRQYRWWCFAPHPEWVTPAGTTVLEPQKDINGFNSDPGWSVLGSAANLAEAVETLWENMNPAGSVWTARSGNFRRPYAAGIPGEVRFIYIPPKVRLTRIIAPTVLRLEPSISYHAYFWEPSTGTRIDLGNVRRPDLGEIIFSESFGKENISGRWAPEESSGNGQPLLVLNDLHETDVVASVKSRRDTELAIILRYQDANNYVGALYSATDSALYLFTRRNGVTGRPIGRTPLKLRRSAIKLAAEVRGTKGTASITDGEQTFTTPIVEVGSPTTGSVGIQYQNEGAWQQFESFEVRRSPAAIEIGHLWRRLYDAKGNYRGEMSGPGLDLPERKEAGWDAFGRDRNLLLDSWRPERLPAAGDWLLVLETKKASAVIPETRTCEEPAKNSSLETR